MLTLFSCFVGCCTEPTVIGTVHKRFGRVVACAGHNPIKHAYNVPLGTPAAVEILAEYVEINARIAGTWIAPGDEPSGGSKVPAVPYAPKLPPSGGAALPEPEVVF